jgi:hypothetical protein
LLADRERAVEHHAEVLRGGVSHQRVPSWRDFVATLLVLAVVILLGVGAHQMVAPFAAGKPAQISLSPTALPVFGEPVLGSALNRWDEAAVLFCVAPFAYLFS